ncbi:MAG: hypothetical protein SOZ58_07340 [Prevotella sp.]|nr:hypothetical protein [Prevotella sp.]
MEKKKLSLMYRFLCAIGMKYSEEEYGQVTLCGVVSKKIQNVHLCKGCLVGMTCMVMPGVTIGEGALVAAGSFVNKDIPAWTVAVGRPAKVVKNIPERD